MLWWEVKWTQLNPEKQQCTNKNRQRNKDRSQIPLLSPNYLHNEVMLLNKWIKGRKQLCERWLHLDIGLKSSQWWLSKTYLPNLFLLTQVRCWAFTRSILAIRVEWQRRRGIRNNNCKCNLTYCILQQPLSQILDYWRDMKVLWWTLMSVPAKGQVFFTIRQADFLRQSTGLQT